LKIVLYKVLIYKKLTFLEKLLRRNIYEYWIEYHIDKDQFWYCEKKGWKKMSTHHTKQTNSNDAIKILNGIIDRSEEFNFKIKVLIDNREDLLIENYKKMKGLFL